MRKWAQNELRKADTNGDGVLSFEEFLDYYNTFVARSRKQIDELYDLSDKVLGKGAFGVVVQGTHIEDNVKVAVKKLNKAFLGSSTELLHNEIAVWQSLNMPYATAPISSYPVPRVRAFAPTRCSLWQPVPACPPACTGIW